MIKKIKDMTFDEVKVICTKARTKRNGKISNWCASDCPLNTRDPYGIFERSLRACDIIKILNTEIEVEDSET